MTDHAYDWDAATLEVCQRLQRVIHLVRVMEYQHKVLGITNGVRWSAEDVAELRRLQTVAREKRAIYVKNATTGE